MRVSGTPFFAFYVLAKRGEYASAYGAELRCLRLPQYDRLASLGHNIFNSFEIYNNSHAVGVGLMKDIATFARSSFNVDKPIRLNGLRFSRATSKQE